MKHLLKRLLILFSTIAWTFLFPVNNAQASAYANEVKITFTAQSGETVSAYKGWLEVPENRAKADSRLIKLEYIRFAKLPTAKQTSSPIIYLAGGPGGSGTTAAKYKRFPLFMAMREFGDVIAFDQRGVNDQDLRCRSKQNSNYQAVASDEEVINKTRRALQDCLNIWQQQGIDIHGYTTVESAHDLDALRQHLNADKISLWGISYGSHLALAALKQMPQLIDKVVISSVEGLDHTIKLPARTDDYFTRLQSAINGSPALKTQYPDIKAMIRKVHQQLEKQPLMLNIEKDGQEIIFAFQKRTIQTFASAMISDPDRALRLLGLYKALADGHTEVITQLMSSYYSFTDTVFLPGMTYAMDLASGISDNRFNTVIKQAKTSLLGDVLNFGLHHFNDIEGLDLGDTFRQDPSSDTPTLVLSGTLDGRTYLESQHEAVQGLSNVTLITVENAGHNLFMASPDVTQAIQTFMRGETLTSKHIKVAFPTE